MLCVNIKVRRIRTWCFSGGIICPPYSVFEGRWECWLLMEMFGDDSSSSSGASLPSERLHPADWSSSFRGLRLRSGSYQSSQQLSPARRTPSPLPSDLTGICLRQVALSGPLAAMIIADVFLPSISFPQSRQVGGWSVAWGESGGRDQHKRCQDSSGVCSSAGNENCRFSRMERRDEMKIVQSKPLNVK